MRRAIGALALVFEEGGAGDGVCRSRCHCFFLSKSLCVAPFFLPTLSFAQNSLSEKKCNKVMARRRMAQARCTRPGRLRRPSTDDSFS